MSHAAAVRHAVSYLSVVAVCFVLDVGTVFVLDRVLSLPLTLSVLGGFTVNVATSFGLQRRLVFRPKRFHAGLARRRYGLLVALNVLIGVLGVSWVVGHGVPYPIARVTASGTLVIVNYASMRWWVFRAMPREVHV